ncbi:MAG: beta-N-acetylhexosaminidase [Spirochaetes bacterium]|nr:MAG: beta-N-acetylhexosaminidase [Spirochaetota bacterium]
MRKILFSGCLCFCAIVMTCSPEPRRFVDADTLLGRMSLEQKIGQLLMVGVPGNAMSDASRAILEKYLPGGIILYGYNIDQRQGPARYVAALQESSMKYSGIPLFISTDQEGGRVYRITQGVTQFPGNMAFGVVNDTDLIYDASRILGMQLRAAGVNMNLAPVLDVNNNPDNPVINSRSFGSRADVVARMGRFYVKGLQKARCIAVGKHFPGHGDTNRDSHLTLPVITHDMERLASLELNPFDAAIKSGMEVIMTAHISYPTILKSDIPATLSREMLTDLLRTKMGFQGLVITDDLEMHAISKMMGIGEAAVRTIEAGGDIILVSSHGTTVPLVHEALTKAVKSGALPVERVNQSVRRILELKLRYGIMKLENGKAAPDQARYSGRETELLGKADAINAAASAEAIYYRGPETFDALFADKSSKKKIVISPHAVLRAEIAKLNDPAIAVIDAEARLADILPRDGSGALVFYHTDWYIDPQLAGVQGLAQNRRVKLVILATGNPFPVAKQHTVPRVLFSFSNSEESMRQIARTLAGAVKARAKINLAIETPAVEGAAR